jgi:hypothetical protein
VDQRPTVTNTQVARRPHIVSGEGVHEIHLCRPGTDAAYRDHVGEHFVVTHSTVLSESDATITTALGEVEHGRREGSHGRRR